MGPKFNGVLAKKEKFRHRDKQGEDGHVTIEGVTGETQLQAKLPQGLPANQTGSWRWPGRTLAQILRRDPDPATLESQTSGLLDCKRINLCCLKPLVCGNLLQQTQETNTNCIDGTDKPNSRCLLYHVPAL